MIALFRTDSLISNCEKMIASCLELLTDTKVSKGRCLS